MGTTSETGDDNHFYIHLITWPQIHKIYMTTIRNSSKSLSVTDRYTDGKPGKKTDLNSPI